MHLEADLPRHITNETVPLFISHTIEVLPNPNADSPNIVFILRHVHIYVLPASLKDVDVVAHAFH